MRNQRGDVCKLRRLGLKEFTARRNVEEQVAHRDRSADWKSSFFDREDLSSCDFDDRAGSVFSGVCLQTQAAHRCDGRQCFAAKSEGCDIEQVVGIADFRRGVTLEGEHSVVVQHAPTIIDDLDKLASTGLDVDADAARACCTVASETAALAVEAPIILLLLRLNTPVATAFSCASPGSEIGN